MDSLSAIFYAISDTKRMSLAAHGSLCYNSTVESCGEDLDDGQYIFRAGSLWSTNGSWEFCNTRGDLHTELTFAIMGGRCRVLDRKVQTVTPINDYTADNEYGKGDIKSEENQNNAHTNNAYSFPFDVIYSGTFIVSLTVFALVVLLFTTLKISKNNKRQSRMLLESAEMDSTVTSTAGLMTSLKVNVDYDVPENKLTSPYGPLTSLDTPQVENEYEYESIDGTETGSVTGIQLSGMSTSRSSVSSERKETAMDPLTEESTRRRQTTAGLEVLFEKSALVPPLPII